MLKCLNLSQLRVLTVRLSKTGKVEQKMFDCFERSTLISKGGRVKFIKVLLIRRQNIIEKTRKTNAAKLLRKLRTTVDRSSYLAFFDLTPDVAVR